MLQVYLTPVPLCVHVESLLSLKLSDDGSGTTTCVQYKVQEPYSYYLKVTFLLSSCFTDTANAMPVTVAFSSKEPVSFNAEVCFFDDQGNSCRTSVYATADNSLLTTHAFLCAEFGRYRTLHDNEKEHVAVVRRSTMISASTNTDDDDDDDIDVGSARMSSQIIQVSQQQ